MSENPSSEAAAAAPLVLSGECEAPPRGRLLTVLWFATGLGLGWRLARWAAARLVGYERVATLSFDERGLSLHERVRLSGRTLREARSFIPLGNLARVSREARYAGLEPYVGLLALSVGTFLGAGLARDALVGDSVSLALWALLAFAGGLVADLALDALGARVGDRCRLVIVPRRGRAFCCARVHRRDADAALERLRALSPGGATASGERSG